MILIILKYIYPYLISSLIFLSIPLIIYLLSLRHNKIYTRKFKKISQISLIVALIDFVGALLLLVSILIKPDITEFATSLDKTIFSISLFFLTYYSNKKNKFIFVNNLAEGNKIVRFNYIFSTVTFFIIVFSFISYFKYHVISEGVTIFKTETNLGLFTFFLELISSILIGPVAEEFFFRGVIYQSFKLVGKKFSMIISAIMWALIHPFNFDGYVFIILFGILLSYLYDKTGTLILPILIHIIWNFWISFGRVTKYLLVDRPDINPVYIYLITLVILCVITLVIKVFILKGKKGASLKRA